MRGDACNCRRGCREAEAQSCSQPRTCLHNDMGHQQPTFGNLLETPTGRGALQGPVLEAHATFDLSTQHIGLIRMGAARVIPRGTYHRIFAALVGPMDRGKEKEL